MQKSANIGNLAKALSIVQSQIQPAVKDANNPFFKTKYADLTSIWTSCRDLLAANGLSVIQGNTVGMENTVIVETVLAHESGEWIQSELCLPLAKNDPQGVGSAVTYGRRYGLAAIVGIVADADDDANHASGNRPQQPQNRPQQAIKPAPQPVKAVEQPTERELAATAVQAACKSLNESGDSTKWAKVTLNKYISDYFGDGVTFENANVKQLHAIGLELEKRLTEMTKKEAA